MMSLRRIIKANELKRHDFYINYYKNYKNPKEFDANAILVNDDFSHFQKKNSNDMISLEFPETCKNRNWSIQSDTQKNLNELKSRSFSCSDETKLNFDHINFDLSHKNSLDRILTPHDTKIDNVRPLKDNVTLSFNDSYSKTNKRLSIKNLDNLRKQFINFFKPSKNHSSC